MLVEILKTDFDFSDERGTLSQLIHEGYTQVNVIVSKAGVFRGGHYHKNNKEAFYIISGKLKLQLSKDGLNENYTFASGDFFGINEEIVHSFMFDEDTILVSFYSNGVENTDGTKDIFTFE